MPIKDDDKQALVDDRDQLWVQANDLRAQVARLEAERDEARKQVEDWVEKSKAWLASPEAAQRLAGHMELGAKCAALEARATAAEKERDDLLDALHAAAGDKFMHDVTGDEMAKRLAAAEAKVGRLRSLVLQLLDGLEGGHTNALYGPARAALKETEP